MKVMLISALVALAVTAEAAESLTNAPDAAIPSTNLVPAVVAQPPPAVTNPVPVPAAPVQSLAVPDPRVGKALMALATVLQSAKQFRCQVMFQIHSEMEGMKQEISASYTLAAAKPNRLALRFLKGMTGNTVVCDGTKMVTYAAMLNRYEEKEAPKSFEQFSQGLGPMAGNILFVDNLLRDDIYAAIMDGVTRATYAEKVVVDGQECDHMKFEQDQFDWELWVTCGLRPVVLRVQYDMAKSFASAGGEPVPAKGMKMTVINKFSDWAVDGEMPEGTFEFKPPTGAHKTESLFEGDEEEFLDRQAPAVPAVTVKTNAAL